MSIHRHSRPCPPRSSQNRYVSFPVSVRAWWLERRARNHRQRSTWVCGICAYVVIAMLTGVLPMVLAGTIGHVAHGKSTVVKAISGVMTVRFKNELVRNITIKLGYANAKVRCPSFFLPCLLRVLGRRSLPLSSLSDL